jgi:hypothetical protein
LGGTFAGSVARRYTPVFPMQTGAQMHSLLVAAVFILMVLSPCLMTLRWHPEKDEDWD